MRGDLRLVDAGRDARKSPKYAVQRILKLIMQSLPVATKHASARRPVMSFVVEHARTTTHRTLVTLAVGHWLLDRQPKRRRHQSAPPPLAATAPIVKEVGVHADDTNPLQRS